jgi:hypothetical protein
MIVLDLIKSSLRLIGVVATDEDVSAADAQSALNVLNMMLEEWRNEKLLVYSMRTDSFNLTPGTGTYTIGLTAAVGNFVTVRPIKIEKAYASDNNIDYEIEIIPFDRYAEISGKTDGAPYPTQLWYNPTYPLGTVYLYPVPSAAGVTIKIVQRIAATNYTAYTTTIAMPEGYLQALRYCLAVELAPEYGAPVSGLVGSQASKYKGILKATNQEDVLLTCDNITGGGTFNIYAGA